MQEAIKKRRRDKKSEVVKLMDRDRKVMEVLGEVKVLSTSQLMRMFFEGARRDDVERRLRRLTGNRSSSGVRYLVRRRYRTYAGDLVSTWALGPVGRAFIGETEQIEVRNEEIATSVLEHAIGVNELYVRLFVAAGRRRPEGIRWRSGADATLSWRDARDGAASTPSRIVPDAVLELPAAGRRLFVEYETGSHPVVGKPGRPGATKNKLSRYAAYLGVRERDGRTRYQVAHPDGLQPELVFVLTSAGRKRSVAELLQREKPPIKARALLLDELATQLMPSATATPTSPRAGAADAAASLNRGEVEAVRAFYREAVITLRKVRHRLRAMSDDSRPFEEPPYPSSTSEVERMITSWASAGHV